MSAPASTLVLFSGGLDSTTLLASLCETDGRNEALIIRYGQRHENREVSAAVLIAEDLGIDYEVVELRLPFDRGWGGALIEHDRELPTGAWNDEAMKATIVPNRNLVFLSYAAAAAASRGFDRIAYAGHADDRAIYPDCRPAFIEAMRAVLRVSYTRPIELYAPFVNQTKADVVVAAHEIDAPISRTWSCYAGGLLHCGACGACTARKAAFVAARCADPTRYEQPRIVS